VKTPREPLVRAAEILAVIAHSFHDDGAVFAGPVD